MCTLSMADAQSIKKQMELLPVVLVNMHISVCLSCRYKPEHVHILFAFAGGLIDLSQTKFSQWNTHHQ